MKKELEDLREQQRLTNMAVQALAKAVESGEWQGIAAKVTKIMLDEMK